VRHDLFEGFVSTHSWQKRGLGGVPEASVPVGSLDRSTVFMFLQRSHDACSTALTASSWFREKRPAWEVTGWKCGRFLVLGGLWFGVLLRLICLPIIRIFATTVARLDDHWSLASRVGSRADRSTPLGNRTANILGNTNDASLCRATDERGPQACPSRQSLHQDLHW
jgi:hypothetical protein